MLPKGWEPLTSVLESGGLAGLQAWAWDVSIPHNWGHLHHKLQCRLHKSGGVVQRKRSKRSIESLIKISTGKHTHWCCNMALESGYPAPEHKSRKILWEWDNSGNCSRGSKEGVIGGAGSKSVAGFVIVSAESRLQEVFSCCESSMQWSKMGDSETASWSVVSSQCDCCWWANALCFCAHAWPLPKGWAQRWVNLHWSPLWQRLDWYIMQSWTFLPLTVVSVIQVGFPETSCRFPLPFPSLLLPSLPFPSLPFPSFPTIWVGGGRTAGFGLGCKRDCMSDLYWVTSCNASSNVDPESVTKSCMVCHNCLSAAWASRMLAFLKLESESCLWVNSPMNFNV